MPKRECNHCPNNPSGIVENPPFEMVTLGGFQGQPVRVICELAQLLPKTLASLTERESATVLRRIVSAIHRKHP